jgi:hypothetical protein
MSSSRQASSTSRAKYRRRIWIPCSLSSSTAMSRLLAPGVAATSSLSFRWAATESLFCDRWIKNTIRNVTTFVTVLATSCQVSE